MHVTAIAEKIGSAPQKLDARALLLFLENLDDGVQIAIRFREVSTFRRDIAVVKRIERVAEFLHELKSHPCAILGILDGVGAILPRPYGRAWPEGVGERVPKRVPVNDAEA